MTSPEPTSAVGPAVSTPTVAATGDPSLAPERPRVSNGGSRRRALVVGLVVGLLVATIGAAYAVTRPATYRSQVSLVMLPSDSASLADSASLFDTLSRGQIVATAATVFAQPRWHASAPDIDVIAGGVTPSAVVQVSATGSDPDLVKSTLGKVVDSALPEVTILLKPYTAKQLGPVSDAKAVGLGRSTMLLVGALTGLLAGVGAGGLAARRRA